MRTTIAVILAALALGACHNPNPRIGGSVNEASASTGTGNTAGQSAAAGASSNSESARERSRETPR
jgi:hypothetical protein